MSTHSCARLAPAKLGFALGLIWGLGVMLLAWGAWLFGYGLLFIRTLSSIYFGLSPSFLGGIFGGLCGFVDFFIFGFLAALVYNGCRKKSANS